MPIKESAIRLTSFAIKNKILKFENPPCHDFEEWQKTVNDNSDKLSYFFNTIYELIKKAQ